MSRWRQLRLFLLSLVFVSALWVARLAHIALVGYATADGDPMILDNISPDGRPGSRRADLTPEQRNPPACQACAGVWSGADGKFLLLKENK
jgi:hypothetical protein